MYTYKNVSYTINQIQEAAKKSNMSVEDYVEKLKADTQPKTDENVEDADLLDPTTFQTDAAVGAGVVSQPMTASQAGVTELPSEDTSSELQDLDPTKPLSASEKRIATRKKRQQEKQDRLKAEAISAENIINDRVKNIPKEDIVAIQANDYFGPIKSRNDRTTVSKTVPGMMAPTVAFEPTFDSDESYTKYLKNTLGGKYDQYLDYKKTNEIIPLNADNESQLEGIYNKAETQAKDKVYNNSLFNVSEDVQEYMVASPKFASGAESLEAQKFLIKEQKESVDQNYKSYDKAKKEWESQALPLREEVEDIKTQIDRFKFYSAGASQEQVDQYNELIQTYNSKIQQWEEEGFNDLPMFLNSQAKLVNSQQKDYSKMLEDSRKALVDADLFEKNLKKDYSTSARVGRAFDEFFVQSGKNFVDLIAEIGLKGARAAGVAGYQPLSFLASPENSAKVDSLIETLQTNNKNYNQSMASQRENIPTAPSIDDIGKDGLSVWDWTSISLQDSSPTILTTFVPGGLGIKGAAGVSKAIKTGKGVKDALQKQKALWLAGKRTVQGTFFVAETGGKYGELQTDEASREQEVKFLYSKLDKTESIEDKTKIYDRIKELEEVEDYSLLQKAFTSFGAGATATYLESIGTLKMLEPAKGLAKQIGINAAKKELYKQPVRFSANLIGKTLSGLKSLPKNLIGETLEEAATEISHNALDILILDENKSMFEGVDKDFIANTMVSSFGIMAPKTGGNILNIVKSEFRTKSEIFDNQKLASELIELNESTTPENSKQLRARKKEILKELALSDATSLHKLRYMTADQIEEVADINRQMRQVNGKFAQLGSLGDLGEAENKRVKKQLENEYSNLTTARQEILDAKQRSNTKKAANINEALGKAARNSEAAFYYGVNNFYNDLTMTQMGDGDFISIKGEIQDDGKIKYNDLENQLAKYKNKTIKDEDGKNVDAFEYLKTKIEQGDFNATTIGKDIIVNQSIIDRNIAIAPTDTSAQYAAVAPLEELFHLSVSEKGIKFDSTAKNAVLEAEKVLKEKRDLGVISEKDYNGLKERFDLYRDGKNFDAEEFIAQMNNAISLGAINRSDLESTPSFKKFLNNAIRSTFGDMSWMLSLETSDDVFNLVKNFQADVSKGVTFQAPETDELKESRVLSPQAEFLRDELTNEELVASIKSKATEDTFSVAQAIVEKNFGLIRDSNVLTFDKSNPAQINAVKEILEEQILGVFEGSGRGKYSARKTGLFNAYESTKEDGASPSTYLLGVIKTRKPEIDIALKERTIKSEGDSIDSDQAKQVVDKSTKTSATVDKLAKKPTETTKFKSNYISPEFKESLDTSKSEKEAIEDKISSTVKESFKDRKVSRFKETGKIPQKLAQLYADMFGIKTTSALIEKQRNLQKLDQEGAVRARQFLIDNAASDFARLPRSKDDTNKATGILQTKIGKVLYNKAGELTSSLKTYTDIIKGKNITLEGYDGKQYEFNQLDSEGNKKPIYRDAQHIKAALDFHIRNRALETLIPEQGKRIQAGAKFSKAQLLNITQSRNINQVLKLLGIDSASVPDNMRAEIQASFEEAIKKYKLTENVFLAGAFAFSGATYKRKADGNVYYKLTNGKEMMGIPRKDDEGNIRFNKNNKKLFNQPTAEQVESKFGKGVKLVAGRGRLYYGVTDPAYKKALSESRKNSEGKKEGKAKRVNINSVNTSKGKAQAKVNMEVLDDVVNQLDKAVRNGMPTELAAMVIAQGYQATTGLIKIAAPFRYFSKKQQYGTSTKQRTGDKFREEHNPPASVVGASIIYGLATNRTSQIMADVKKNYYQTKLSKLDDQKLDEAKLDATLPAGTTIADNPAIRFVEAGIDLNSIINYETGKTMAEEIGVSLNPSDINLENVSEQNKIIKDLILGEGKYKNPQAYLNDFVKLSSKTKASKINNNNTPSNVKFSKNVTNQEALDNLGNIDKALSIARNPDAPVKKIRVFDFDDTLATTKSNVLYTMPNGETGSLTATEFAKKAGEMEAQGAEWDFSEFSKVMKGAKGPLLDVAKFINDAKGERDVFVLTARPQDAAGPIKEFLDSMGLNIPLENITGLGDGTAQAKARWMVDKAAEGYNDFYFADDATKNVKAVRDALSVLDVKSKVQQAYVKFSKASKLNKDFNNIIEGATGIASEKVYGKAKAQVAGASRGKVFRGIAYSAQDFVGLLYETLGKGKEGDAQMAWYKQNLLDPYARAMNDLSSARLAMMNDYRALKKQLGIVPKNLRKKIPGEPWTREQAVRVYVWSKQGTEVPGISKADLKDLNSFVANNAELQVFADQLIAIQKGDMYPEPGESWVTGSISTDMLKGLNTIKRVKYLEQWQANVDAIFSKENKNKLEAAYGIKYVKALENSLERMKTGRNRSFSDDSLTGRFTDWLQGSVGAIMFFNTRSAILQTLSAVNFINFTDNNPYAAAKAFGNQKQYWKDFTTLMNSDFLKERRSGLRMNVNEADIADMAKQEGPRGVINKLLQLGFAPTQIADSFAIASGGATFYRNRAKTYMKEGMDQAQAEEKAFQDFRENAEESQQSSRPDKISAQQAGPLGRLILAFANTPAQYARLTDKAIRDLKNKRGDAKTNISKIIYYTTVQNIIFNAVQQALFAMAFGDEEPEDEKKQEKYVSIANGMADSLLRGTGIAGSVISVGKNAVIRIINESKKKRPKYEKVGYELTKISPPVSAKLSRINQAARAYEWNKEDMMTKGFSLDNPAFLAGGNVVSALTNIPLDRVVKKVNNVTKATESDLELWERVALFAGWQDWELGIKKEEKSKKKKTKSKKKQSGGITFDEF